MLMNFRCPHCGSEAKVIRSEKLLTDVTLRERRCEGSPAHQFRTRVMEETIMDGSNRADFLYQLAFTNALDREAHGI